MKIVNYMEAFYLEAGGVTRAVLALCAVLATRGHEVTLLTCGSGDVPASWTPGAVGLPSLVTLQRRRRPLSPLPRTAVSHAAKHVAGADVLHLHGPWDPACLQLARLADTLGVRCVVSLHGMLDDWCMTQKGLKKRLYLALGGRRMLERAAAVQCTAEAERDQSARWFPAGRAVVVPLIFDLEPFLELPGPECKILPGERDGPLVLFVGRLHPIKRVELLIEAMTLLETGHLVIAGTGDASYERSLRQVVEQRGLAGRVTFAGFVTGRDKVSLYQAADVFVLPSHHENWGFVSFESLACETPVITTRDVNTWPELEASGGAVVVEPDAKAVAAALTALADDATRRCEMGRRGRDWVLQTLGVDRICGQYETLYRGDKPASGAAICGYQPSGQVSPPVSGDRRFRARK